MVFGYQSSRDFFEAVRCAAQEMERTERQLQRMRLAEGVRAQRYEGRSARGGEASGMGATDARMDFEGRMRRRLDEDRSLVAKAVSLCYGDGSGGVCALLGSMAADSVYWRFCRSMSWQATADAVGASVKTVQRWCGVALDTIDAHGSAGVAAGVGAAEA